VRCSAPDHQRKPCLVQALHGAGPDRCACASMSPASAWHAPSIICISGWRAGAIRRREQRPDALGVTATSPAKLGALSHRRSDVAEQCLLHADILTDPLPGGPRAPTSRPRSAQTISVSTHTFLSVTQTPQRIGRTTISQMSNVRRSRRPRPMPKEPARCARQRAGRAPGTRQRLLGHVPLCGHRTDQQIAD